MHAVAVDVMGDAEAATAFIELCAKAAKITVHDLPARRAQLDEALAIRARFPRAHPFVSAATLVKSLPVQGEGEPVGLASFLTCDFSVMAPHVDPRSWSTDFAPMFRISSKSHPLPHTVPPRGRPWSGRLLEEVALLDSVVTTLDVDFTVDATAAELAYSLVQSDDGQLEDDYGFVAATRHAPGITDVTVTKAVAFTDARYSPIVYFAIMSELLLKNGL